MFGRKLVANWSHRPEWRTRLTTQTGFLSLSMMAFVRSPMSNTAGVILGRIENGLVHSCVVGVIHRRGFPAVVQYSVHSAVKCSHWPTTTSVRRPFGVCKY